MVASNDEVIKLTREIIDLHKQQKQDLIESRNLLIESRDLDRKRIGLLEESKAILKNTNVKLRSLFDDTNGKLRSLIDGKQPNRSRMEVSPYIV